MQEDTTMPAFVDPEASGGPERARMIESWKALVEIFRRSTR
jgi:hypothetical protein